jgi:hypothetical protein
MRRLSIATALVVGFAGTAVVPLAASAAGSSPPVQIKNTGHVQKFTLYDGSKVEVGPDGMGWRTDANGQHPRPFTAVGPQASSVLGDQPGPNRDELTRQLSTRYHSGSAPGTVLVALSSGTVNGARMASQQGHTVRAAHTTDARVNSTLKAVGATSAQALLDGVPADRVAQLSGAASHRLGSYAVDLTRLYTMKITGSSAEAARRLRATPGVAYAEPDFYVSPMDTGAIKLPGWVAAKAAHTPPASASAASSASASPSTGSAGTPGTSSRPSSALPDNFGLTSSLQSYLNSSGVDVAGAYADIAARFGQIPGQGETITNVSVGDLTDQAMADAGDSYVKYFGPTTIVQNGQRYLDYPSLPLIPTYTVDQAGAVNPLGTVEGVDPNLGEVLLDFSVMSPLPHDRQRADAQGSGPTDLLGIAPGANYRLVEPTQPTFTNILTAMVAAAQQSPKPNVITASLGFGTDVHGFAGRYLEDDPVIESVVAGLVQHDGIAVTISSNDGTRMFTPAPVGPDGGSIPTNLPVKGQRPTSVADDAMSTTPSVVPDSGAIAVGGTTLDDTVAVPPQNGGPLSRSGTFAETRLDGSTNLSSGFGTRVNVSAPSDNIVALNHACCTASSAVPVLTGGTSASAPMTAAAVADVLQVARLTGHPMDPAAVRTLLEQTGRAVATQPQIDRDLHVGPQIDVTRAVEKVLGGPASPRTQIVRLSVAHRAAIGGAGADFTEMTDPNAIDLSGPVVDPIIQEHGGEGLVGPITIGVDAIGVPRQGPVTYVLRVGSHEYTSTTPSIRLLPAELLADTGQPLASKRNRTVSVSMQIRRGPNQVLASATQTLTFGPTDGTHEMAPAPVVAPVVAAGKPVTVQYDLTGLRKENSIGTPLLENPQLIVSSINHWSPFAAPLYRIGYAIPLKDTKGTVTVPGSAFAAGAGVYGVAVLQNPDLGFVGAVASLRIDGGSLAQRPAAPTVAASGDALGHQATIDRADSQFRVSWNASAVPGATGATLEISAPGPGIYGLYNNFTNANGSGRDDNGVDSGSTYYGALPAVAGTRTFDAKALGLPSSLHYSVRVFATAGRHPIGQASASSSLEYDDGLAPDGAAVTDFDINPGGASTVATAMTDGSGRPVDSSLYSYTPSTATYGPTYAHADSGNAYVLYGSDPTQHRVLAGEYPWNGTQQHVLTYDTDTHQQIADAPIDAATGYKLFGGRVDEQRHRAALLAHRGGDDADVLLPVDTTSGTVGKAVEADNGSGSGFYSMLDIDRSTGKVDLVGSMIAIGDLCIVKRSGYTTVDLDRGTAAPMTPINRCDTGVASDQAGNAEVTIGPLSSFSPSGPMLPQARLQQVDEASGQAGDVQLLEPSAPLFPVVDTAHHLLIVGFLGGKDWHVNNNGMSAIGVYDLRTGAQVSLDERFDLIPTVFSSLTTQLGVLLSERGIQLDPATRTGWTYGPNNTQVQQFHY